MCLIIAFVVLLCFLMSVTLSVSHHQQLGLLLVRHCPCTFIMQGHILFKLSPPLLVDIPWEMIYSGHAASAALRQP